MKSIKKGHRFLCIKDYVMSNGSLGYKSGQIYESPQDGCLSSILNSFHKMDMDSYFNECFEKQKKKKPVKLGGNGIYIQNIPVTYEVVDTVVESVVKKFQDRSKLGIKKYGTTLDRKDINFDGWAEHLQQELMDGILYLERLRKEK